MSSSGDTWCRSRYSSYRHSQPRKESNTTRNPHAPIAITRVPRDLAEHHFSSFLMVSKVRRECTLSWLWMDCGWLLIGQDMLVQWDRTPGNLRQRSSDRTYSITCCAPNQLPTSHIKCSYSPSCTSVWKWRPLDLSLRARGSVGTSAWDPRAVLFHHFQDWGRDFVHPCMALISFDVHSWPWVKSSCGLHY